MSLLFITHKFPPSIGGMQKQSYELINHIRSKSKTHVIIQSYSGSKFWFLLTLRYRIVKMLKKYPDITVIHCNDGLCASLCTWLLKRNNIAITATLHGLDVVFPNMFFQKYILGKLKKFDRLFLVSEATKQACISRGFDNDKLSVIRNGVDRSINEVELDKKFPRDFFENHGIDITDGRLILGVGRAVKRKGFSWFASSVLSMLDDNVKFITVGPSNRNIVLEKVLDFIPKGLRSQIELLLGLTTDAKALNQVNHPRYFRLDKLPYYDLLQLMSYADIVVMPNISVKGDMEGFGLVALEAALRETVVLAANLEGISCAVVNGKNGWLLTSENPDEWISSLRCLFSLNRKCLNEYGIKSKEFVMANYSWERMASQYLSEFLILSQEIAEKRTKARISNRGIASIQY